MSDFFTTIAKLIKIYETITGVHIFFIYRETNVSRYATASIHCITVTYDKTSKTKV